MPDPGKTGLKKWLPDLDSNQDKLNQNQLCYRYTIGQNTIYYIRHFMKCKPKSKKKGKKLTFAGFVFDFPPDRE